jgi:Dolichyl-phosphate-mannose-protein mannosyltransferase/PA14 domain
VKTEDSPRFRNLLRLAIFLIGVGAIAYGQWHWTNLRLTQGLLPMLLGISFVALSCADRLLDPASPEGNPWRPSPVAEACFLVAVVVAAGCLRFIGLDHIPPGGFFDEVQNHLVAEGILKGDRPIFIAEWTKMPALFFYVLAGAIAVAGKGLGTVRGLSALIGTLTVPGFYFLARRAFVWPVAAATTILLAGSRWHITFSRVGFATIVGPLLEVLALLCLWKAMETRRRLFFLFFGAVVGVGLQTYYSFNLFPAVLAVAVATFAARKGWKSFGAELRPILRGLAWSVLVAVVLLLPLAQFVVRHPRMFFERSNEVAIWNPAHRLPWPAILWQNAATNLLMFNYRGDYNPRHNIPGVPMLNPAEGFLLAVGIGAALARGSKWPQATWLVWFFAMLLPAILTIESPQSHRAVGAIPAVYLLIGQGLQPLFAYAAGSARRIRMTLVAAVLLVASLAAASRDLSLYFGPQVRTSLAWQEFQADHHEIGKFLKPYANRFDIFVSPLYFDYNIERFYLGPGFPCERFRLFEHFPISPERIHPDREGLLYVLEPFQEGLFPLFHALYEHARMGVHRDPYGRTMFVDIQVPRDDLAHQRGGGIAQKGFLGAYWSREHWTGEPTIVQREPAIWFHSHWDRDPLPHPFTAQWAALLRIDEPGEYAFELATSGPTVLSLDQKKIFETSLDSPDPQRVTVQASPGQHLLAVSYWEKSFRGIITLAWQPPHGKTEVIPLDALTPLPAQDFARLRDSLPRPDNER